MGWPCAPSRMTKVAREPPGHFWGGAWPPYGPRGGSATRHPHGAIREREREMEVVDESGRRRVVAQMARGEIIMCFANIYFSCNFPGALMCQTLSSEHKTLVLCHDHTEDALFFFTIICTPSFDSQFHLDCFR